MRNRDINNGGTFFFSLLSLLPLHLSKHNTPPQGTQQRDNAALYETPTSFGPPLSAATFDSCDFDFTVQLHLYYQTRRDSLGHSLETETVCKVGREARVSTPAAPATSRRGSEHARARHLWPGRTRAARMAVSWSRSGCGGGKGWSRRREEGGR